MNTKSIKLLMTFVLSASFLTACQQTDVLAEGAYQSFSAMISAPSLEVSSIDDSYQQLKAPSGDYFALATRPQDSARDVYASFDLAPFEAAGLNVDGLPEGYASENGRLIIYSEFTDQAPKGDNTTTDQLMKHFIAEQRSRIGYHAPMDHYGIELGNGNMIEWAADVATNDKDLVFILEPSVLMEANLDPERLAGWVYADVEIMDAKGNKLTVKKLLKPFDLD